jgi:hypothetical protein
MVSVSLVLIGTIVVIVPFFTLLLFKVLVLLTLVFNPAACFSTGGHARDPMLHHHG